MNTAGLVGSHYVLAALPIWATVAVLVLLTYVVLYAGREYFEGMPYNVATSAIYGDAGFVICILIAAGILQRRPVEHAWLESSSFHWGFAHLAVILGLVAQWLVIRQFGGFGQYVDTYHNLFIVPLFVYLLVTILPVIYLYGTITEKTFPIFALVLWVVLYLYDVATGRLEQRDWLRRHGWRL